jgi:hypothetical protein
MRSPADACRSTWVLRLANSHCPCSSRAACAPLLTGVENFSAYAALTQEAFAWCARAGCLCEYVPIPSIINLDWCHLMWHGSWLERYSMRTPVVLRFHITSCSFWVPFLAFPLILSLPPCIHCKRLVAMCIRCRAPCTCLLAPCTNSWV